MLKLLVLAAVLVSSSSATPKCCIPDQVSATNTAHGDKMQYTMDFKNNLFYYYSSNYGSHYFFNNSESTFYNYYSSSDCLYEPNHAFHFAQCIPDDAKLVDNPPEYKTSPGVKTYTYNAKSFRGYDSDFITTVNKHCMPLKIRGGLITDYNWSNIQFGKIDSSKFTRPKKCEYIDS